MTQRVTFSSLACPHWSVATVIENARAFGYDGIEWRGGEAGHINPSWSREQRRELQRKMQDANLISLALTSYTSFVSDEPRVRAANVDSLRQYLDLAAEIGARFVRAFVGELAPGQTVQSVLPRVLECFESLLPHARAAGIGIAIEHHDDFVRTSAITPILSRLADPLLGAVWDIANAYSADETPEEGARNLRGRIAYVQVKDGVGRRPDWQLTLLGEGQVPLRHAFELLKSQDYTGALSVEWEYAWHPELPPPEIALPAALKYVRDLSSRVHAGEGIVERG